MKKAVTFAVFTLLFGIPYLGNSAGTSKPAGQTGQAVTSALAAPSSSPSSQPVTSTPTAAAAPASGQAKTSTSTTLSATSSSLTLTSTPVSASAQSPSVTVISAPAASWGEPLRRFHRHLGHRHVWPGQLETGVTDHRGRSDPGGGLSAWAGEGLDNLGERLELLGLPRKVKRIEHTVERPDNLRERLQQEKGGGSEFADQPQGSGGRQNQRGEQRLLDNRQPNAAADSGSNLARRPAHRGARLESSGERLQDNEVQELQRLNVWLEPRDLRNK
ncbi:MAG: hypothetical protein ACLQPD_21225 [Desulfomonilaceae bacterium]